MNIATVISQRGYIESVPACRIEHKNTCSLVKKSSEEEFAARIVTAITPYLNNNISEKDFMKLQSNINRILKEHGKDCRK